MEEKRTVERTVRESAYHIIEAKGYTNYGVALAVSRIAAAVLRDEKSVFTVSTRLQGQYGLEEICLSVPCVVGANGVERIVETDLSPDEAQGLARSAEAIRSSMT
jgi:L-lactate dehydrogenase